MYNYKSLIGLVLKMFTSHCAANQAESKQHVKKSKEESCLEASFVDLATCPVDTQAKINFNDYLNPNEGTPTNVKEHLDKVTEDGVLVSTGTERSFFDLVLSHNCTGLVVRDINPRVKAYVDFNVLLLRISKDRETYLALSEAIDFEESLDKRRNEIRVCFEKNNEIPEKIRAYYQTNFDAFSEVYFSHQNIVGSWRQNQYYDGVKYHLDDSLFLKLQRYAKNGNIISTIGDINDLFFLDDFCVSVVDTSNISDYIFLDIKTKSSPRIIWTNQNSFVTGFFSYQHTVMGEKDRQKFEKILQKRSDQGMAKDSDLQGIQFKNLLSFYGLFNRGSETAINKFDNAMIATYSTKLFEINDKIDRSIVEHPDDWRIILKNINCYVGDQKQNNLVVSDEKHQALDERAHTI